MENHQMHADSDLAIAPQEDRLGSFLKNVDRTVAFRRARKHMYFVKLMKFLLPAASLASFGIFFIGNLTKEVPKISVAAITVSKEGLKMSNPRYEGFDKKNGKYTIEADYAKFSPKNRNIIHLYAIRAQIINKDNNKTFLDAGRGRFMRKNDKLFLFSGVNIKGDNGLRAKLQNAEINLKTKNVTTDKPLQAIIRNSALRANSMTYSHIQRDANFVGRVKLGIILPSKTKNSAPSEKIKNDNKSKNASSGLTSISLDRNKPLLTYTDKLKVQDSENKAFLTGNVVVIQDKYQLNSVKMDVHYAGKLSADSLISGQDNTTGKQNKNEQVSNNQNAENKVANPNTSNQIKFIKAYDGFKIVSKDGQTILGQEAHFHIHEDKVEMKGTAEKHLVVKMPNGKVRSPSMKILVSDEIVHFDENVHVSFTNGTIKSGKLKLFGKKQFASFNENVVMLVKQPGKKSKKPPRKKKKPQNTNSMLSMPGADTGLPIRIQARKLEISDKNKSAEFTGKVIAKQGKFSLRSEKLNISYQGKLQPNSADTTSSKKQPAASVDVKTIQASGKVLVLSPHQQTATSKKALFDVKANKVTMTGNVVITQKKNILTGNKLILNLNTGKYKMYKSKEKRLKVLLVPGK